MSVNEKEHIKVSNHCVSSELLDLLLSFILVVDNLMPVLGYSSSHRAPFVGVGH